MLLAEDDDAIASHVVSLIGELDPSAHVLRAVTASQAISLLDATPGLAALLVSAQLPDGPGARVAQWTSGALDAPPSVLLADHEDDEVWETAIRSGIAVVLPRDALTAGRLRGGLTLAAERSRSDRLGRLVTDAAAAIQPNERIEQEAGAVLAELLRITGVDGVRVSVGVRSGVPESWSRGTVGKQGAAALNVTGRTGEAAALLELFDGQGRSWSSIRPPLTSLCEIIAAALVRRESVERVKVSEARLRALAENVPDAIVSVDAAGRIAAANERFAEAVGRGAVVGARLADLVQPRGLGELAERAVAESRQTAMAVSLPDELVAVRGAADRWFGARATPDDAGTVHVVLPDTTDRVLSEQRLTELALTDHLTGLANRRLALDRLQHALDLVGRVQSHVVVSLCDVDHFKATNDLFGHSAGDAVLLAMADRLRGAVRLSDTAARLGGDEFLIVSESVESAEAAKVVAGRLHDQLCGPVAWAGQEVELSVSLGYVVVTQPGRSADEILRQADVALYAAKAEGRGRAAAYVPQSPCGTEDALAQQLDKAWRDGGFLLRWAPIAGLDRTVHAARGMLWWIDDEGNERDPDTLAAVLSNGPLFGPVRRWVMRQALRQRARWVADGAVGEDFAVHVRVFARQLADPDLAGDVQAELRATGTPPHVLVLDVEDNAIASSPGGAQRLDELAALGVRIYLDRFGSGPVALDRLTHDAVTGLRLDGALLADVWRDHRRGAVVDCILAMGTSAGLDIIVDGVNHTEQLHWLSSRPSVAVAGPLVGEPMELEVLLARLAASGA